jgi:hypothetical protein
MIEFDWKRFDYLGHKFVPKHVLNKSGGWSVCLNCDVKVYVRPAFEDRLMYWDDDLFHKHINFSPRSKSIGVVQFDLTCNEVMIKKLLE